MINMIKKLHLYGCFRRISFFLINAVFTGTKPAACRIKRSILRALGFSVGNGTTIVGPIHIYGSVAFGSGCWINRGFTVHGNGHVEIGDNCDIGPDAVFLTGGHKIGDHLRRAGKGEIYTIKVGSGCWIGARSTILKNVEIGDGSVVAACACVTKSVLPDSLVGGTPAKQIRDLTVT